MYCCGLFWRLDRSLCHAGHLFFSCLSCIPTQFSLALTDLGNNTKSGSAFLVMAIVGNACLPQLTAYMMHLNEHIYHIAYTIPMICFLFCAYYGWKGYKVID